MDIEKELTWIENAIEELSKTAEKDGISWRASYTPEDQKGTELLKAWMEEKGFCTYFDEVGESFFRQDSRKERGSDFDRLPQRYRKKMAENMMERWASLRR